MHTINQKSYEELDAAIIFLSNQPTFNDGNYFLVLHTRIMMHLMNFDETKIEITRLTAGEIPYRRSKYKNLLLLIAKPNWLVAANKYLGYAFSPSALDKSEEETDFVELMISGGGLKKTLCFEISTIGS